MVRVVVAIVVGLVLATAGVALLLWLLWLLWKHSEQEEAPAIEIGAEEQAPAAPAKEEVKAEEAKIEEPAAEFEPSAPDDLKRIEGIGPKIASVLQEAGITTYAQLADTSVDRLRQILEDTDPRLLRLADPSAWPEQAALAAADEWEALEALKGELKAGRRR